MSSNGRRSGTRLQRLAGTTVCYPTVQGEGFSLDHALRGIKSAGLDYVELVSVPKYCEHFMPEAMEGDAAPALRKQVQDAGLTPVAANIAADLTTDAGVERLVTAIRIAPTLHIGTIVTHIEQTETPEGAKAFLSRAGRIVEAAEAFNVRVGIETHGGLCNTGRDAIQLVKSLQSKQIGVTYDTANVIYWGGVRPEEDLASISDDIAEHVFHFHLKDKANMKLREYVFPSFGEGIVDFEKVLAIIVASGYDGYMSLEVELDGYPETSGLVDSAIVASRNYLQEITA
jgi:sugar phosphate isomerase/epimerase